MTRYRCSWVRGFIVVLLLLGVLLTWSPAAGAASVDTWRPTGSMTVNRHDGATATLLPSGLVLVAGGNDANGENFHPYNSAELYDPATGTWHATGSMTTARMFHTATLLSDGTVLVAGGFGLASAEIYTPATGTWRQTGSMATARVFHTATALADGRVLVVGGDGPARGQTQQKATAEVYDPRAGIWRAAGTPSSFRTLLPTATLLRDGTVLVTGGCCGTVNGTFLASAERYDPATNTWRPTGTMSTGRTGHTATLLADGTVLVAGGSADNQGSAPLITAEIYNPTSGAWRPTGRMRVGRELHTATRLLDGTVLVAGGATSIAERYDPVSGAWLQAGAMTEARKSATATLLPDGTVLVAGGSDETAERFYPGAAPQQAPPVHAPAPGAWLPAGTLAAARRGHIAILLQDGTVLVAGGCATLTFPCKSPLTTAERYDPRSGVWQPTGSMNLGRTEFAAVLLPDGGVLVVGGVQVGGTTSAERYDPVSGTWRLVAPLPVPAGSATATLLRDGTVLVTATSGGIHYSALRYDPAADIWRPTSPRSSGETGETATLLPDGSVLVVDTLAATRYDPATDTWRKAGYPDVGGAQTALLPDGTAMVVGEQGAAIYDPVGNHWRQAASLTTSRASMTATTLHDGTVLVVGGMTHNAIALASTEVYDPPTDMWHDGASMGTGRRDHTATLLSDGTVLVVGGRGNDSAILASAERYVPAGVSVPPAVPATPALPSLPNTGGGGARRSAVDAKLLPFMTGLLGLLGGAAWRRARQQRSALRRALVKGGGLPGKRPISPGSI